MNTLRILGKRGRITVPREIRKETGLRENDVISFEAEDRDTVVIRRASVCTEKPGDEVSLLSFLDSLSEEEQTAALVHLYQNAKKKAGINENCNRKKR